MKFPDETATSTPGRINLGRSLAKAGVTRPTESKPPPTEDDALRVSIGGEPLSRATPTAPQARVSVSKSVAQGLYAKQIEQNGTSSLGTAPTGTTEPASAAPVSASPEPSALASTFPSAQTLAALRADLLDDGTEAPKGPTPELVDLARRYVALQEEQSGAEYSKDVRDSKVTEVANFYAAPSRAGRLQDLVAAFES